MEEFGDIPSEQQLAEREKLKKASNTNPKPNPNPYPDDVDPPQLERKKGTFYVIQKTSKADEARKAKRYLTNPIDDTKFEPSVFGDDFRQTEYEVEGTKPSFDQLSQWNSKSFQSFIEEPAVRFVRDVASKINEDWQTLFENPNEALTEYLKNTIPEETGNLFGTIDVKEVFQIYQAQVMAGGDQAKRQKDILDATQAMKRLKKLWKQGSSSHQAAKEVLARELFLGSIFHAPFVIFKPRIQGPTDMVLTDLRRAIPSIRNVDKKLLFTDLIESEDWMSYFAQAVAYQVIKSKKNPGFSQTTASAARDAILYVKLIGQFQAGYRYNEHEHLERGAKRIKSKLDRVLLK